MKNEIIGITVESKIRNEYTNGKFVTKVKIRRLDHMLRKYTAAVNRITDNRISCLL